MTKKRIEGVLALIGGIVGISIVFIILNNVQKDVMLNFYNNPLPTIGIYAGGCVLGVLCFYVIGTRLLSFLWEFFLSAENSIQNKTSHEILTGCVGLIIGLIIANLISKPFLNIPYVGVALAIIANIMLGYIGINVAVKKKNELGNGISFFKKDGTKHSNSNSSPKIFDTSVIIDGRIADICKTGFIEGPLIIPKFVLKELQHIADSSDPLKRNRGRRGLDILNIIQKEMDVSVKILDKDFKDIAEVDSKLLKLAEVMNGKIITNDYNLNKVASFQGVPVLNINELANALKPIVLPGEEMFVHVVKDGKENGQGIAYLDDGTMIVVDGGKRHMGESIDVLVTSVLQTPAGRMIFAKPKYEVGKVV